MSTATRPVAATSTLAQLLFAQDPALNFARLVSDLDDALDEDPGEARRLRWDHEDFVFFDRNGSRITLGYRDGPLGHHAACLTVAAGFTPDAAGAAARLCASPDRQDRLCQAIVQRILGRYPAADVLWHETDRAVTPDLIDAYTDALARIPDPDGDTGQDAEHAEDAAPALDMAVDRARSIRFGDIVVEGPRVADTALAPADRKRRGADPADLDRILRKLDDTLEERRRNRLENQPMLFPVRIPPLPRSKPRRTPQAEAMPAALPSRPAANDLPDIPPPMTEEMRSLREALSADSPSPQARPSTQLRLACHAINTTLIVIALPVGAAMMTYSILRGENVNTSARMLALSGMAVGLQHSPVGAQIMSLI